MCYNCKCEMPDDDHGHPENITDSSFSKAAKASNQSGEEAKRETLRMLKKELGEE